jgi:hypothetical protein
MRDFSMYVTFAAAFFRYQKSSIFLRGNEMDEIKGEDDLLTLKEVAEELRCSKTHVSNLINGKVSGIPMLTHLAMGRRKVVQRRWLDTWKDAYKRQQC